MTAISASGSRGRRRGGGGGREGGDREQPGEAGAAGAGLSGRGRHATPHSADPAQTFSPGSESVPDRLTWGRESPDDRPMPTPTNTTSLGAVRGTRAWYFLEERNEAMLLGRVVALAGIAGAAAFVPRAASAAEHLAAVAACGVALLLQVAPVGHVAPVAQAPAARRQRGDRR